MRRSDTKNRRRFLAGRLICWLLPALALAPCAAQTRAATAAPRFEVLSLKHVGNVFDGGRWEGSVHHGREWRAIQYNGLRLSGELPLTAILKFAYPLAQAGYCDAPGWMGTEWYRIDAVAPAGSAIDDARAMVRTALAERLGLQYHLIDKERRALMLRQGAGVLKLAPSTEKEKNPGLHKRGVFQNKSASLTEFAAFLSTFAGSPVVDETGIPGRYKFDVDWSSEVGSPLDPNRGLATEGAKRFGLKLEPGNEMHKWMVIDRANREPTPN